MDGGGRREGGTKRKEEERGGRDTARRTYEVGREPGRQVSRVAGR